MNVRLVCVTLFMCALLVASSALAQSTGSITGIIRDAETGEPMPSASVRIQGTSSGVISGLDGQYRLQNLDAGRYTLVVSYVGYSDIERSVSVQSGTTTEADFDIESELIEGGEVVVKGSLLGQARALNRQKNAETIQNVVSADEVGRFPDQTTAESLQRVPAVSVVRDMGEGRYVMIRGMNPDLNSVSVNGNRLPSPDKSERRIPLDVVSSDIVGSLEVNKTLTPEMDADAIGGSVNIVTKSSRDYLGRKVRGTLAGGLNMINDKGNSQAGLTYADTFGKWGITVSGNYSRTNRATHNNKFDYSEQDVNGVEQLTLEEFNTQDYTTQRTRLGLSGTLDYELDSQSRFYVSGIYNWYDDDELRRGTGYEMEVEEDDGMTFNSPTSFNNANIVKHLKDRRETQVITSFSAGGEHVLDNLLPNQPINIDYQAAYSFASEVEPDRYDTAFETEGVNLTWDDDPDKPRMYSEMDKFTAYEDYEFDELEYEDNETTDTDFSVLMNVGLPMMIQENPLDVKFGAKIRLKTKENNPKYMLYGWDGDNDFMLSQVLGSYTNDDYMDGDMGDLGKYQDPDGIINFFKNNKDQFELEELDTRLENDTNTYSATENIYAGYGQAKYSIGNLSVLGGLRIEATSMEYEGNEVILNEEEEYESTQKKTGSSDYVDLFPSLQAKYTINEDTNLRAAFGTGISRPNYYSLVPFNLIDRHNEEIVRGNPDLDPTKSFGLDFIAEHYFRPMGLVSAGVFYKSIDNHIFESVSEITYSGEEYDLESWINGDTATVMGMEVNYNHQLTFLPGVFNGIGVTANYTFTDSEADMVIEGAARTTDLPGQSANMGNFAVFYEKFGFMGRLAVNHQSEFLSEVGEEENKDYYIDKHTQIDLSLNQKVYQDVSLFFEIQNLTDEPLREYEGDSDHPKELEFYGRWINFGVKVDF